VDEHLSCPRDPPPVSNPFRAGGEALASLSLSKEQRHVGFQTPSERAVRRWASYRSLVHTKPRVSNPFRAGGEALLTVQFWQQDRFSSVSNPFRAGGEALLHSPRLCAARLGARFKPLQSGR